MWACYGLTGASCTVLPPFFGALLSASLPFELQLWPVTEPKHLKGTVGVCVAA
jgi:hypothetical protein